MTVGAISVGILTPHLAAGPEVELPAMAPGRVATQVARIAVPGVVANSGGTPQPSGLRELATPDALEEAAATFAPGSIDAIAYASTSSAYTLGFDTESAMVAELSRRLGLPVASTCRSAVQAVRMLNVERLALVHPPWFDDEVNELGASYFASQGVTVIMSASADLANDLRRIETEAVVEWVTRNVPDNAEAIFFGGNGFLAAGAIDRLETTIGPFSSRTRSCSGRFSKRLVSRSTSRATDSCSHCRHRVPRGRDWPFAQEVRPTSANPLARFPS